MKLFTYITTLISVVLIIYNATNLNFSALFEGKSIVAIITILASLCAICLVHILRISKKIEVKSKS